MDSKLAVLSTTNHLYNTSLYDTLTHESLVCSSMSCMQEVAWHASAPLSVLPCYSLLPGLLALMQEIHCIEGPVTEGSCQCGKALLITLCAQVSWQRVRVANALASSGEEWVSYLDYLNSGTYNNQ